MTRNAWIQSVALPLALSLAVNFAILTFMVVLPEKHLFDLEKVIPVDLLKIYMPKPPPKPKPKPKPKKVEKFVPLKAPIAPDPEPKEPATIETHPEVVDIPAPVPRIYDITDLDGVPKIISRVPIRYPSLAKRAGKEGVTVLKILITREGKVGRIEVIKTPPNLGFDKSAVESVRQFVFTPPTIHGEPVDVWYILPVRFVLED